MFVYILKDAIHSTHGRRKEKSSSKSSWQGYVCSPEDRIHENPKDHDSNRTHAVSEPKKNNRVTWAISVSHHSQSSLLCPGRKASSALRIACGRVQSLQVKNDFSKKFSQNSFLQLSSNEHPFHHASIIRFFHFFQYLWIFNAHLAIITHNPPTPVAGVEDPCPTGRPKVFLVVFFGHLVDSTAGRIWRVVCSMMFVLKNDNQMTIPSFNEVKCVSRPVSLEPVSLHVSHD